MIFISGGQKETMKNLKVFASILFLSLVLGFMFVIPVVSAFPNATTISTNVTNGTWFKAGDNLSVNFTFTFTLFNTTEIINSLNFTSLNYTFWNVTTNVTGFRCDTATTGQGGNLLNCTNVNTTSGIPVNISLNLTLNTTNNGNDYANGTARTITINWTTNGSSGTANSTTWNFSLDGTVPVVSMPSYSNGTQVYSHNGTIRKNTQDLTLNISLTDTGSGNATAYCIVDVNGTNQTFALSGAWCNTSSGYLGSLSDGNRTIKLYVNDSVGNLNMTNASIHNYVVMVDTTKPSATATCSPKSVTTGATFPCTCAASDATSGVANTTGSSTASDGTKSPSNTGTFTYTCTAWDKAVNTGDASATYTVETLGGAASSGSSSSGGGSGAVVSSKTSFITEVNPGTPSVVSNFNKDVAVNEIKVEVNNKVQNVEVHVTKYDGKPAEVSTAQTGKVYQYMQINLGNVGTALDKATVEFKVNKSWASTNSVTKDQVQVSKFNETSKQWMNLGTVYSKEDSDFYYYNVELHSFSFFAISSKATTSAGETGTTGSSGSTGATSMGSSKWIWILVIAVVVVAVLAGWGMRRKK